MKVLRINAADTYKIRQQMLREGLPIEESMFEGDGSEQTFHLGAFIEGKLVSVASFFYNSHPDIPEENQYQVRGMATLPEYQKKGLSRELLTMAFPIVKQNFCEILWCNARSSAIGFYEKVGFNKVSDEFEIPGVGPHFVMKKSII